MKDYAAFVFLAFVILYGVGYMFTWRKLFVTMHNIDEELTAKEGLNWERWKDHSWYRSMKVSAALSVVWPIVFPVLYLLDWVSRPTQEQKERQEYERVKALATKYGLPWEDKTTKDEKR